jgi:serine/threonine protein kinase
MGMMGRRIAHYEVLAKIGAGGMGEVYRARDLRLQREVAIKFLSSALPAGSEERERLKREARALASLNHPNIVTVYSVEEEDGTHFVTMELLEGEALDTIVSRGRLPQKSFIDLALQLLEAIRAAHKQGIVHRDLKPSNIIVTSDRRVKVLDFGIAKVFACETEQTSSSEQGNLSTRMYTKPGVIMGTIAYFSPEQAQGQRVDHRSDIFSLGIVLYQMSTGRHPFPGENSATIVSSILRDTPAPIAEAEAPWLGGMRGILDRCLEKDPEKRYQDVSDIIDDVISLQAEATATVRAESTADLVQAGREALERHSWTKALEYLQQADAQTELSPLDLEHLAEAAWWTGKMEDCCHLLERAYAGYLREKQQRRAALISLKLTDIFYHRAARSVSAGWLKRAERLLENAEDTLEYGYLLRFQTVLALEVEGDAESALRLAKQSFAIASRTEDKDLLVLSTQDQGRVLVDQGQLPEGMALLDEAMATALSGEIDPLTVAKTYCNMISACERTADYRRASEWTEQARYWCEPHEGSPFPGICSVHRAEIMRLRGSLQEAEDECNLVCADPRGYVDTAAAAFNEIGEIRLRSGDYSGAEEAFRNAHERGRDPVPGLPLLLLAQGKTDAARSLITRALAGSPLPLDRARLLPCQVRIALATTDVEAAIPCIEELESIASQFGSAALHAMAAHCRGSVNLATRNFEEGATSLRRALKLWLEIDLPYEAAMTRMLLAQAYRGMGDEASADLELRAARSTFERLGAQAALRDFDILSGGSPQA